jgi:outer membrane protein OmpA-like peptidoglycan-associated protein
MKNILLLIFLSAGCKFSYSQKDSSVTRVYFEFGKSGLSGSTAKELDRLTSENSRIEKIKITGQTDQIGTNSFNDRLSLLEPEHPVLLITAHFCFLPCQ